jgi:hypothetical protein
MLFPREFVIGNCRYYFIPVLLLASYNYYSFQNFIISNNSFLKQNENLKKFKWIYYWINQVLSFIFYITWNFTVAMVSFRSTVPMDSLDHYHFHFFLLFILPLPYHHFQHYHLHKNKTIQHETNQRNEHLSRRIFPNTSTFFTHHYNFSIFPNGFHWSSPGWLPVLCHVFI